MEKRTLIVALHGFLGEAQDWHPLLTEYINSEKRNLSKQQIEIFCPQFFQEGEWSPRKSFKQWQTDFAKAVQAWHLQGYELHLLGYSMGGRLALGTYLENPAIWQEAHFFSVNPGLSDPTDKKLRYANDCEWATRFLNDDWSTLLKSWNAQPVFAGDFETTREQIKFSRELLGLALTEWSLARQENNWPNLNLAKVNCSWWVGEKDTKFVAMAQTIATNNPQIKINTLRDCGHRILFFDSKLIRL